MKFMDLCFKRYASPFTLLNEMIRCRRFNEYVGFLLKQDEEDTAWEYYLHKVFRKSFNDFKKEVRQQAAPAPKKSVEATITDSKRIASGITPH